MTNNPDPQQLIEKAEKLLADIRAKKSAFKEKTDGIIAQIETLQSQTNPSVGKELAALEAELSKEMDAFIVNRVQELGSEEEEEKTA